MALHNLAIRKCSLKPASLGSERMYHAATVPALLFPQTLQLEPSRNIKRISIFHLPPQWISRFDPVGTLNTARGAGYAAQSTAKRLPVWKATIPQVLPDTRADGNIRAFGTFVLGSVPETVTSQFLLLCWASKAA
ncbi:hypothetical protein IFM47457_01050 [Aspergillus lentulus]|nr:hypothetical protein IFM47457_01050 [Aspergillus lentulus]